jgi:polysaccharide export outer membrane protein
MESCVSKEKMIYFQEAQKLAETAAKNELLKIQEDDELMILVSASDASDVISAKPFNLFLNSGQGSANQPLTYLVDANGIISFPVLGDIEVKGKTTLELKEFLTEKLSPYLNKPIVNIRLENFRFSVMGEVKNSGVYVSKNERVSIPEAIAMAGDLTIQGKRKNVLLIRKNGDKYQEIRLDLTDASLFSSPYFYLAQNDVIYVEPNKARVNSSAIGTTSTLISIASALLSIILIITR